jgi:hypothetical protein
MNLRIVFLLSLSLFFSCSTTKEIKKTGTTVGQLNGNIKKILNY